MYNCHVRWYTVVDKMSVDEMSVDEVSWNRSSRALLHFDPFVKQLFEFFFSISLYRFWNVSHIPQAQHFPYGKPCTISN